MLRPQLEQTLEVEEVLLMRLVDVRQRAQTAVGPSVGVHQSEGIVARRTRNGEAIQLAANRDGTSWRMREHMVEAMRERSRRRTTGVDRT